MMKQQLVPPYSQEEINTLTPGDIERDCLQYRLEANKIEVVLEIDGEKTDTTFCLVDRKNKRIKEPTLPLKIWDKLWHTGWDIPTHFAIDREDRCWINNGHGGHLEECTFECLIEDCEEETTRNEIRKAIGKPVRHKCSCCNGTGWID